MASLRCMNYKLDPLDWVTVKLKAGRIIPALATTTACIAALQTIELVKIVKKCDKSLMKNAFLNLAVPLLQLTEPGAVPLTKIHDKLSVSIWDRWELQVKNKEPLGEIMQRLQALYGLYC
jgi:hypothetical protein